MYRRISLQVATKGMGWETMLEKLKRMKWAKGVEMPEEKKLVVDVDVDFVIEAGIV